MMFKTKMKALLHNTAAKISAVVLAAAATVFAFAPVMPVHAAGTLTMSTQYPGISSTAGATVSFDLDFDNETGSGQNTSLTTTSIPDGWTGFFEGNNSEISNVFLKSGENDGAATYNVTIPDDAKDGTYNITLKAQGGATSTLELTIKVSAEEQGTSSLTTEYAEQEGASGTTFSFTSTIQNTSNETQSYSFSNNAPEGWTVKITPSGSSTQVNSVDVDGGDSQALSITVTPPDSVAAGEYDISLSAISADQKLSTDLKVTITGTYALTVTGQNGVLSFDTTANEKTAVTLTVTNTGNVDLNGLNLTSTAPTDWTVEFSESSIDTLAAGASKEITMYVTPADDALTGDYEVDVTASNDAASVTSNFRATVKTSTAWGIVGIVIIAAVIAGLVAVFHKFGRH